MQRIGVNFGAPGDRLVKEDSLWLDYPGEGLKWVAASGAEGLSSLSLSLGEANDGPRDYTVRLYFAEPDNVQPGERIFDVSIGEIPVLVNFDPIKVAGGRNQIGPHQNLWVNSGEEAVFLVVGVVVPTAAANVWPKAFLSS